jgi:hypothetical protein
MIDFFVPLACELPPRQHAAELLGKSDDRWVRGVLQGISTAAHFASA